MATAVLKLLDESGRLSEPEKEALTQAFRSALLETGLFDLANPASAADLQGIERIFIAAVKFAEDSLTGKPCWDLSLVLLDAMSRQEIEKESTRILDDSLAPYASSPLVKELAYRYATVRDYVELTKKSGMTGAAQHPELLKRDPKFLMEALSSDLMNAAWDKVLEHSGALLAIQPENGMALHGRALGLHKLGRSKEALESIGKCLELHLNPLSWLLKGDIACDSEDYPQAQKSYEEALRLDPNSQEILVKLNVLLFYVHPKANSLLFTRIGWRVGYLTYVQAVVPELTEDIARELVQIGASLQAELEELSSAGLEYFAGSDSFVDLSRALKQKDREQFKKYCDFFCRGLIAGAERNFPRTAFKWFNWGYRLLWAQVLCYSGLQNMKSGGAADLARLEEAFSGLVKEISSDSEFVRRSPELKPVVENLSGIAPQAMSVEKLKSADSAIEAFRRLIFAQGKQPR